MQYNNNNKKSENLLLFFRSVIIEFKIEFYLIQEHLITESDLKSKADINLWKDQRDDDEEEIVVRI